MLTPLLSDNRLIERITNGNAKAFDELVKRYEKRLYYFCFHLLQNRENAEDIVQHTFLKFWQNPDAFDTNQKTLFSTWIYQVAKNKCTDHFRKNNRMLLGEDNDLAENIEKTHTATEKSQPDIHYEQQEQYKILQKAINTLEEDARTIVILFHLQNKSQEEVAQIMQMNKRMVEGHLYRARAKMKLFLQEDL
jgi:RNA polymerase sigma-70 factor (ECF subfamily)